jgi:hypothetical protein
MKIKSMDFKLPEGEKVNFKKRTTRVKPVYPSKELYQVRVRKRAVNMKFRNLHYPIPQTLESGILK